MSLWIAHDEIREVLLADGWHSVKTGTFYLDSYEFTDNPSDYGGTSCTHGGGQSGVCATGFSFVTVIAERDLQMFGPLTAILAVTTKPRT